MKLYNQLSKDERNKIEHLYNVQKKSISQIARELNRNKSTISREIKRNKTKYNDYIAEFAEAKSKKRQYHKHMFTNKRYPELEQMFKQYYDKRCHGIEATYNKIISLFPDIRVPTCRQLFNIIKNRKWVIKRSDRLRMYYKKGGKRTKGIFSKFDGKYVLPIWTRPKFIDSREEYGHWEVDFIVGRRATGYANLITLSERKTRLVYIKKIYSKNPMKCNAEIKKMVQENNLYVKSITCDNGIEFEKIGLLAKWLNIKVYFCEPYASYQRGSNEHVNGIIRRFYKKGTDFNIISEEEILDVQNKINLMPRKIFGWKSSLDYFQTLKI